MFIVLDVVVSGCPQEAKAMAAVSVNAIGFIVVLFLNKTNVQQRGGPETMKTRLKMVKTEPILF